MKNLINFFFSFDKLMKEKLVIAFFWLALIIAGLNFFQEALSAIKLGPLAAIVKFILFFGGILLTLVTLRLICELAVALFRINDNLSPDGGKSETADIDPIVEARKAAEAAALKARDLSKTASEKASAATKTAVEKTKSAADSVKESTTDAAEAAVNKTKAATSNATKSVKAATPKKRGRPAGSKTDTAKATKPVKKTTLGDKTSSAPNKRGRPAGSKNKTKSTSGVKTTSKSGPKKRGPKPGSKAPRDAQGRLLKKDGTLRAKPGPKKK
jgi:hypothetical protein